MGTSYAPNIVKDGLVFYVDAANPRSYPGSGTQVNNLIGTGTGSLAVAGQDPVTFETLNGGCFDFDGSNDKMLHSEDIGLASGGDPFSAFQWVRFTSRNQYAPSLAFGTANTLQAFIFNLSGNTNNYFKCSFWQSEFESTVQPSTGVWYNLAFTYGDGGSTNAKLYVDGSIIKTGTVSLNTTLSGEVQMGSYSGNSDQYDLNGKISSTFIYNRALTQAEVKQNYNALKGRFQ